MVLLCGECEFKASHWSTRTCDLRVTYNRLQLVSDSAFIDRKIKFRIPPKTNIALKYLRNQVNAVLASQMRGKPQMESQILWMQLAMAVMGKLKLDGADGEQQSSGLGMVLLSQNRDRRYNAGPAFDQI